MIIKFLNFCCLDDDSKEEEAKDDNKGKKKRDVYYDWYIWKYEIEKVKNYHKIIGYIFR